MNQKFKSNKFLSVSTNFYKFQGILWFLFSIFIIFGTFVNSALATSISEANPEDTETVIVSGSPTNSLVAVYSPCDTRAPYSQQIQFSGGEGDILLDPTLYDFGCLNADRWHDGIYYVLVFTDSSQSCYTGEDESLAICQAQAAEQFIFRLAIDIGGGNITPDVSIFPFDRNVFGNSVPIRYEAGDSDDERGNFVLGLGPTPVSLYYTEGDNLRNKILITKNLPATGSYTWDTKDIPSGNLYRIIALAQDKILSPATYVSNYLTIDHSVPVFNLVLDPSSTKGEDVKIMVEASEELISLPELTVTQKGYKPFRVILKGLREGSSYLSVGGKEIFKKFEGVYKVISGYDGMAEILISGEDVAGNIGTTIKGNNKFAVGIEPPPQPVIISPLDQDITASNSIDVLGKAREDLEILLSINGEGEFKVKPDAEGDFLIKNVPLSATYNKGLNFITVIGRDSFGNTSEAAVVNVKLNANPAVFVRFPQRDSSLNKVATITISASDENNDELRFKYEIAPVVGASLSSENVDNWTVLAEETKEKRLKFDTTKFPDGQYKLRITTDDGFIKDQIISEVFYIRNSRPVISFNDGDKTIIGQSNYTLAGLVIIPEKVRELSKLISLEYSLDGGQSWISVSSLNISPDFFEGHFSISLSDLKEGRYDILLRAKDSRGFYGNAPKILIVDFGPPLAPVVRSPSLRQILSNSGDQDPNKAGVQFTINGTSEPESEVKIELGGAMFGGKTGADGRFAIQGVTLREHGLNNLKIYAIDPAGNKSPETQLSLIYNNPPVLKFLNPRPNRGLGTKTEIKWEAVDPDGDEVGEIRLSYRKETGRNWLKLIETDGLNSFEWDTTGLPEGNYQLKIEAGDSLSVGSLTGTTIVSFSIDHKPPTIFLEPFKENVFTKKFMLKANGRAIDDSAGVEYVEFSLDKKNWFKATLTKGFLKKQATFVINKQLELTDGEYELLVRSVDAAGNLSLPVSQKIIIDTKPPRIGSFILQDSQISLLPEGGLFKILKGRPLKLTLSLEGDTQKAGLILVGNNKQESLNLIKNNALGLWEADLVFLEPGNISLAITAEDRFGNKAIDQLAIIDVVNKGRISGVSGEAIGGVNLTVLVLNEETNSFVKWQAEDYGQNNPVVSSDSGEYELVLPAGTYQLLIQKSGFRNLKVSEFNLDKPRYINSDFRLEPREGIRGAIEDFIESF